MTTNAENFRDTLSELVVEAIDSNGGRASLEFVARFIWQRIKNQISETDRVFYTWQYDMRWAAQKLRNNKVIEIGPHRCWQRVGQGDD